MHLKFHLKDKKFSLANTSYRRRVLHNSDFILSVSFLNVQKRNNWGGGSTYEVKLALQDFRLCCCSLIWEFCVII